MTGPDDGAQIIQLHEAGADHDAPIREKRDPTARPPRECRCQRTDIVPESRQLVCRDCGQLVDPFDFLLRLARADGQYRRAREAAEAQARLAEQRRDDLLRQETNARARVGRLKGKEAELSKRIERLDAELRAFTPDQKED